MTHASLKTIAAFLNTEGGDLLIGVDDDGTVLGVEPDGLGNGDRYARHVSQQVINGLGTAAATHVDPRMQRVDGKWVCLVSCQRAAEPVYLTWKGLEKNRRVTSTCGRGRGAGGWRRWRRSRRISGAGGGRSSRRTSPSGTRGS
ncbi:MAG: helix-turn-helix domain-containing protein [Gemmatimonadota bacterium]